VLRVPLSTPFRRGGTQACVAGRVAGGANACGRDPSSSAANPTCFVRGALSGSLSMARSPSEPKRIFMTLRRLCQAVLNRKSIRTFCL